ncbi:MAG: hypothetical protein LBV72_12790 [Tannerella sp.]|jgi:hypothetical protein|nr:hypothetical protein [Tannerella sp.]
MKKIIVSFAVIVFLVSCKENLTTGQDMNKEKEIPSIVAVHPNDVMVGISLTVAESKRLIAKGIAKHPLVQQKMKSGTIIITRGTTNTYIAEELAGLDAPHGRFVTGNIMPVNGQSIAFGGDKIPEIVLVNGELTEMSFKDALASLKEDDLVFKGGNLLNYEKKQAAVTVGAADGGTVGRIQPYTNDGPAHLIVPIGLEKEVYGDLNEYEVTLAADVQKKGFIPRVIVHRNAEIFTEIEAIRLFGNVSVIPYASGGIGGSEGGKSFVVYGVPDEVEKVLQVIAGIQGEKGFIN